MCRTGVYTEMRMHSWTHTNWLAYKYAKSLELESQVPPLESNFSELSSPTVT